MKKPNPNSGWKIYKFDELAHNVAVRVDPAEAKTDLYVGLEHLDPESLHLRRWGHPSDVTGQKLEFKKGDVIFGRRRAYQRKLAIAEFDGICSAHAMVVRAKPDVILPKFLPFFLQSDMFMERAVNISVGSLSPTINWKTLKIQEFHLPSIEEQRRIAEILWAADDCYERKTSLKGKISYLYDAVVEELLFNKNNKPFKVQDLSKVNRVALSNSKTSNDYTFNYIDISSVVSPKKLGRLEKQIFETAPSRARRCVQNGDILVSTVRPNLRAFVKVEKLNEPHVASTGFAVITPKNDNIGRILFHSFFSKQFFRYCDACVTGTNYPAISAQDISRFKLFLPDDDKVVLNIKTKLDSIENISKNIDCELDMLSKLKKVLLEDQLNYNITKTTNETSH